MIHGGELLGFADEHVDVCGGDLERVGSRERAGEGDVKTRGGDVSGDVRGADHNEIDTDSERNVARKTAS